MGLALIVFVQVIDDILQPCRSWWCEIMRDQLCSKLFSARVPILPQLAVNFSCQLLWSHIPISFLESIRVPSTWLSNSKAIETSGTRGPNIFETNQIEGFI